MDVLDDTMEYEHFAPSCEEFPKDENLEYSNDSFKKKIEINKPSDGNIPLFPEPQVFAHFSIIAYDKEPEVNLDLAPDWEVLTTATNIGQKANNKGKTKTARSNGYFGVAFWHLKNHHLVIAHRGTNPKCLAALKTDFYGIIHNEFVWQMFSAATFVLEVVEAFRKQKIHFQLFFTGHSLGGWLAQITTFTIKYLHLAQTWNEKTLRSCFYWLTPETIDSEKSTSVHAHTVVFDSPGCKEMLLKLSDKFDVRYSEKIVEVSELDITSYMSAPNWVNTRNAHVGTIYRVYFPIENEIKFESIGHSWLNSFAKFKELYQKWNYTKAAHYKKQFLEVFVAGTEMEEDLEESENSKNTQKSKVDVSAKNYQLRQNVQIREVIDWPESSGLSGGNEFDEFLKWASGHKIFSLPLKYPFSTTLPGCYTIRYQVKIPDKTRKSLNVFTQNEKDFLEQYQLVRAFQNESELLKDKYHEDLLSDYKIDNLYIHCSSGSEKLNQLAAGVPFLLRKYENLPKQIQDKLTPEGVATFHYLKSINQNHYSFNSNLEIVATILESDDQIWEFTVENSTAAFIRFVDSLRKEYFHRSSSSSSSSFDKMWRYTALSYKNLMKLTKYDQTFLAREFNEGHHQLVVINCGPVDNVQKRRIDELKRRLNQSGNANIKLILIASSNSNCVGKHRKFISSWEWKDLSTDTKRRLMGKTIALQGKYVTLSNLLFNMGRAENLSEEDLNPDFEFKLRESDIMSLMASDSVTPTVGGHPPRVSELEAAFVKCGNSIPDENSVVNFIKNCKEQKVVFKFTLVTPSSSSSPEDSIKREIEELEKNKVDTERLEFMENNFFEESEKKFKELCKEKKPERAYWFSRVKDKIKTEVFNWKLEMIFDANFFVHRDIHRVAVKQFVCGNIGEFKFLNFSSPATIRSRLNVSDKELSDESLENRMISRDMSFEDTDTEYILMSSDAFPQEFVLSSQKPSQDKLSVFREKSISVVVDEPGMGKSTTLVQLGDAELEAHWVIHIPLKNCNFKETTAQNLLNFLWSHGCGNENDFLEKSLFQFRLQHLKRVEQPFLILLDGYDEIQNEDFQKHVSSLIQKLSMEIANTNHRMVVSTRRHAQIEETLQIPFTLQFIGFDSLQQKKYLRNAWERRGQLLVESWDNHKSEIFISKLLQKAGGILSPKGTKFISIPLQLRLISVAYFENYLHFLTSHNKAEFGVLRDFTLGMLYTYFVSAKYQIYRKDKIGVWMNQAQLEREQKSWEDGHRKLAISAIRYGRESDLGDLIDELYRIGLVIKRHNEPASFIHQSFAEYFVAVDICEKIFQENSDSEKLSLEWLMKILAASEFKLIRVFLDNLLETTTWSGKMLPKFSDEEETIIDKCYRTTAIIRACEENLVNILKLIFILRGNNLPTSVLLEYDITSRDYLNRLQGKPPSMGRPPSNITTLHLAATHGSLPVVKYLVSVIGENCKHRDIWGKSALDLASENGHLEIVKFLLTQNVDLQGDSQYYGTPLHAAAAHGHLEIVRELLKHFDVDVRNRAKRTPIHEAALNDHLEVVKFLIEEMGADISLKDFSERNLIHMASHANNEDVLQYILAEDASRQGTNKPRIDDYARSENGMTALHHATSSKSIGYLRVLLERKTFDIDQQDNSGNTALHLAGRAGNLEAVRCLTKHGADVNIFNERQQTALDYAIEIGHVDVVQFFLDEVTNVEKPPNYKRLLFHAIEKQKFKLMETIITKDAALVNTKFENGETPLWLAVRRGQLDMIQLLLSKGAKVEKRSNGESVLHMAARHKNPEVIKKCLQITNINLNDEMWNGWTPLHDATKAGLIENVKQLVEKDCDVNFREQISPLHIAAENGDLEIVKYLVEKGKADVNSLDSENKTPLHFAIEGFYNYKNIFAICNICSEWRQEMFYKLKNVISYLAENISVPFTLKREFGSYDCGHFDVWKNLQLQMLSGLKNAKSVCFNYKIGMRDERWFICIETNPASI